MDSPITSTIISSFPAFSFLGGQDVLSIILSWCLHLPCDGPQHCRRSHRQKIRHRSHAFHGQLCSSPFFSILHEKRSRLQPHFWTIKVQSVWCRRDPKLTLQNYPNLNKAFQQVNAEVDAEIAELESRIRSLEGSQSRQAWFDNQISLTI